MTNMVSGNTLAAVAALIGDVSRASILAALLGGKALTAGELAECAGVSPQTASNHLSRLVDGQLVTVEKQGRHRYFRLASAEVAETLEHLSLLSAIGPVRYRPTGPKDEALRVARTCYDHMAGAIAVGIADSMVRSGAVVFDGNAGMVTERGEAFLTEFGISLSTARKSRRALCRTCLDWSERRPHIGGWLGAAMLERCCERHWLRPAGDGRALTLTRAGQVGLVETFGLPAEALKIVTPESCG
ncbi:winged helix-turn-helix transcriptional regulator [Martelella lutilitoris]|uniref:Winged helix-turn-helix transcriptional regulator n=2 Tax=Martelella lutilitoris TaxID=2583532 RepID=A0A5C4JMG3_9HYPH|nr:winged helix-turn-helix domain-containing protein [Martelella lutilitoris]TNB46653.1 winged helix-turn-helix transcriptional regulator [Martelella lutilitoris]